MDTKEVVFKFDGPNINTESLGKSLIALLCNVYQLVESCSDTPPCVTCIENNCITIKLMCVATTMLPVLNGKTMVHDITKYNASVKAINTCLRIHGATLDYFEPKTGFSKHFSGSDEIPIIAEVHHEIRSTIKVYGELIDIGGVNPNAHIMSASFDEPIKLDIIDVDIAKTLAKHLYDQIGVDASVVIRDGKIVSGKVLSVIDYEPQSIDEWLKVNEGNLGVEAFRSIDMDAFIAEQRI